MNDHEKRIREALEAGPTEGPWVADDNEGFSPWSIWSRMSPTGHGEAGPKIAQIQCNNDEADAAFIAACNPAAIRALLADLDAARAALSEAKVGGWQDISTAPEGTMILCANMNAREARDWCFVAWMAGGKVCGHRMDKPTHWQPLPNPPKEQA